MSQPIPIEVNMGGTVLVQQKGQILQLTQDDKKVIQQIRSSHSPDADIVVDKKSILNISQNILNRASPSSSLDSKADSAVPDDKASGIPYALAITIHEIGCELSCNCTGEGDLKAINISVFNILKKYEWDAKVVLALAAFTARYGEFCLLSQLHASNTLAKYIHILKPLPDISERESLITELLKVVVQVSNRIIELIDLPTQYISRYKPPLSDALALVPASVYLAIKAIVACSVQTIGLVNVGHQYAMPITEFRKKLTEMSQTLKSYYVQLTSQLDLCRKHIDDVKNGMEIFVNLVHIILEIPDKDSMEIFKAFIHTKEDLPLFNGVNKKRASLDVLKGRTVIFFFSYLDISDEEIQEIIQQVGKEERKYEMVWIPIIEVPVISNEIKQEILRKATLMPWYSLHYSLVLHPGTIKFVKEKWHFEKKPLLVVFNAQGNIICPNAYHMLMTWGSQAYPFDAKRERTLWEKTKWNLQFLVHEIDRKGLVQKEKLVCFYGGDDMDWIRKFTSVIKEAVKVDGVILELIYVGKKRKETIRNENLSNYWDRSQIKRFRARLDSIMNSKMQLIKTDAVLKDVMTMVGAGGSGEGWMTDAVLKDVVTMVGAEGSGEGWMLLAHESEDMVAMYANLAMDWLKRFKNVKETITFENFFIKVIEVYKEISKQDPPKHCIHIVLQNTNGINQESMVCVICNRRMRMEKVIMYKCCDED